MKLTCLPSSLLLAVPLLASSPAWASYAFYVGKNLTQDQGVLVGGTGEEVSSHWLEIVPAVDHEPDSMIKVGVTEAANIPGQLIEIPQVAHTFRYLSMSYSDYAGFPAPLTNGGVNEHQVAVRDVWATNREELIDMTPTPQRGPQYSDLARLVLERATTARVGVELIGELIAEHGYSTYGGNTHLIADPDEGWVVWEFAGGQGLWAAERLGPDDVRVLYPGYIEKFPLDYRENPDFMGSDNLITFAEEQGWFDSQADEAFNVFEVYGRQDTRARTGGYKYMTQAALEKVTEEMAPVDEREMMARVRDHRIADDEAGYGQVVSLRKGIDADLIRIWVAPTGSLAAPFLPWWLGVQQVPLEYGQHRYLTKGAASNFLNPDFQVQEASDFAGRRFKQVMYLMCEDPDAYRPQVTELLEGFEQASFDDMPWVERSARTLIDQGQRNDAREMLTFYAHGRAEEAMDLGETLVDWLYASLELTSGLRRPGGEQINDPGGETVNCLVDADPDKPQDAQ
ncbi:Peptidase family C69 [Modicisalibacter ilicicola DSM 19980]|uniref:Dipeptidase n=1 Tax=Modicisalibacter ilicicola DSM 19980 TaxID=1121942 RepID=A0A1M5DX53_9GAMM|nr:C69 family dipeptidase [Halomonas ilicicola]SHF71444.1 Peptidase family C69 [Halomonas ilicicola DSM 19980]